MNRKGEIGKKLGIGLSVIFTVFWLVPYIYVICCSFKPGSEVIAVPPSFFQKHSLLRTLRDCLREWMHFNFCGTV